MYLSKHSIFSSLHYILALELFKYILSLEYVLVSGKFARIIHDIWGNPLDIEGNQFPLCSFFFFSGAFDFADESGSISCKGMPLPLWLHESIEMYKEAKVSLCCSEEELSCNLQILGSIRRSVFPLYPTAANN